MAIEPTTITLFVSQENIRSLPDPNNLGRRRWFCQVEIEQIQRASINFGPNPRMQNLKTRVGEAIQASLRDNLSWFLYYNKGIVLCAKEVTYDRGRVTLVFDKDVENPWESPHGNLDGGHTNAAILKVLHEGWENPADNRLKQYVTVEILTGINPDVLSDLVGARNTNIAVNDLSLAILGDDLDWLLKEFAKHENLNRRIAWRQFDAEADIKGEDVIAYLSLLNPELKEKTRCYSGAGRVISDLKRKPEMMKGLRTTKDVAYEYLQFVDWLHTRLEDWYLQAKADAGENGKFGNLAGISIADADKPVELVFLNSQIRYRAAKSWLMPLAAAFAFVIEKERKRPEVWRSVADSTGPLLIETIVSQTGNDNYNLNAVGKNKVFWDAMRSHVKAAYYESKEIRRY